MLKFRCLINRRHLLHSAGAMCLFSISQIGFSFVSRVISVRICPSSTCTRIIIESNQVIKYKQFILTNPKRLVLDLDNININQNLKNIKRQIHNYDVYIKSCYIGQYNPHTVRMVFKLKKDIKPQIFLLSSSTDFKNRLIINLHSISIKNANSDPLLLLLEGHIKKNFEQKVIPTEIDLQNNRMNRDRPIIVMIDPGHGGEDPGAVGKHRTQEKDVVLQIALRLKSMIDRENNMRTYMTRYEDVFIPLNVRVAKAQKQRADLFVSIHADAFTNSNSSGSSVFALSKKGATTIASKYLSNMHNISNFIDGINKSRDRYVDHTIFDMIQFSTIIDSMKFGKAVLNKIAKVNKLHNNNVEQASFTVLKSPEIPSILVETAFISNLKEERKLKTVKFQKEIGESILAGIKAYFSDSTTLIRCS